jgi:hypothetical protein
LLGLKLHNVSSKVALFMAIYNPISQQQQKDHEKKQTLIMATPKKIADE